MNQALQLPIALFNDYRSRGLLNGVDLPLVTAIGALLSIGVIFCYSSSVAVADHLVGDSLYFVRKHLVFLFVGLIGGLVVLQIPISFLLRISPHLLFLALILLVIVLIPGIGEYRNGSRRWIGIGPLTFQVSEFAKVAMILFISGYVIRRQEELREHWSGFSKPLIVLGLMLMLLLLEPDFGTSVVMTVTVLGMLFLAGIHILRFTLCMVAGVIGLGYLVTTNAERMSRIMTFVDPWADQFNAGYQLTQALIAFGRGEWFGLGLGNSLQKLSYLPEAHTDFVFAVIAEETGLIGVSFVIAILWLVALRIMHIGRRAFRAGMNYESYVCFGLAIMFSIQSFINIGVASGLLPTKGLTLPFISYGGSSLLIWIGSAAIILRISRELSWTSDTGKGMRI